MKPIGSRSEEITSLYGFSPTAVLPLPRNALSESLRYSANLMQLRPKPTATPFQDLSASAREHVLGPVETEGAKLPALTRHRRPLPALTGLRFFAASYVVIFHTRVATLLLDHGHRFAGRFFRNGYLAVALFFILSGFILAYTYRGQMGAQRAATRFWEARFARLWPAYALSLLCSSLPGMGLPSLGLGLATLCMVQAWNPWHPEYAGAWNFVCWTLSVEAFFYLVFPLAQRLIQRLSRRWLWLFGAAVLCAGVLCNVSARTLGESVYPAPWNWVPLPVIHLPEFLIGAVLGNLFVEHESRELQPSRTNWPILTSLALLLSVIALATLHGRATSLVLVPFSLLVAGLAMEPSAAARLLSTPLLLLGGAISYSMYLLQTPVRLVTHAIPSLPGGVAGLVVVPAVLLPLAYGAYRFVEEPARLGLRRLFARLAAESVKAAKGG